MPRATMDSRDLEKPLARHPRASPRCKVCKALYTLIGRFWRFERSPDGVVLASPHVEDNRPGSGSHRGAFGRET